MSVQIILLVKFCLIIRNLLTCFFLFLVHSCQNNNFNTLSICIKKFVFLFLVFSKDANSAIFYISLKRLISQTYCSLGQFALATNIYKNKLKFVFTVLRLIFPKYCQYISKQFTVFLTTSMHSIK